MGSYNEDEKSIVTSTSPVSNPIQSSVIQPRASTSSLSQTDLVPGANRRTLLKDQIQKSNAMPVPISQLAMDGSTAKFFTSADPASPTKSPIDKGSVSSLTLADGSGKSSLDRASAEDPLQPSSLPISSTLSEATPTLASISERSASELGHYPDLQSNTKHAHPSDAGRPERSRASYYPSLTTSAPASADRPPSPDKAGVTASLPALRDDTARIVKISGPMNGTPIPAGYKFGSKDPAPEQQPSSDRERKARSRAFWRWPSGELRVHL